MPKKQQKVDLAETWSSTRISVFLQTTAYTVMITAILGGGGYLLDQQLGTFPTLFIIGIVIAFPVTQVYLYKKFKSITQNTKK